jgi:hypothetical protein
LKWVFFEFQNLKESIGYFEGNSKVKLGLWTNLGNIDEKEYKLWGDSCDKNEKFGWDFISTFSESEISNLISNVKQGQNIDLKCWILDKREIV